MSNRLPPELHLVHGTKQTHKGGALPDSVRKRVPKADWLDNPDAWDRINLLLKQATFFGKLTALEATKTNTCWRL